MVGKRARRFIRAFKVAALERKEKRRVGTHHCCRRCCLSCASSAGQQTILLVWRLRTPVSSRQRRVERVNPGERVAAPVAP